MLDAYESKTTAMDRNAQSTPALDLAAELAVALGAVERLRLRPQDQARLEQFEVFRFGPGRSRMGWSVGEGPLIVLVHGYSGLGAQMAVLAQHLAERGFRCVLFDAGGHGASAREKVGFSTFIHDTRHVIKYLDTEVHALVGHSAGALAMMRARALLGVSAQRYAVISAPLFPYVPLDQMRGFGATEEALDHVKAILADQFEMSWSDLAAGAAYAAEDGAKLFAACDVEDRRVRSADMDAMAQLWEGAELLRTEGYGHNKILQAPEVLEAVAKFVAQ